jgi:subtilisin family serine protease
MPVGSRARRFAGLTVLPLLLPLLALCLTLAVDTGGPGAAAVHPSLAILGEHAPAEVLAALAADPPAPAELRRLGFTPIEHYERSRLLRLRVHDGDVPAALARLRLSGLVAWAEPNYRLRVAELIPDDPLYQDQAGVWGLLGAPDAWSVTTGSARVVVAVLDGAIDLDHPDLAGNIWTNRGEIPGNGIDDDANGYIDDVHGYDFVGDFSGELDGSPGEDSDPDVALGDSAAGDGVDQDNDGVVDGAVGHGTRVAGIIAARGNNGLGVPGTAWRATIMPVRVTDPEGNGFFSSLVRALEYAVANDADVVNISLASSFLPESARLAVEAVHAAGLILVGAAGNTGADVVFPAALPQIIAVGSHGSGDDEGQRAGFSPRGPGVDIVAPGEAILTTDVLAVSAEPEYAVVTGTSFSAAFVTGAIALALSIEPTLGQDAVFDLLAATATDLADAGSPRWDGAGRLDIGRALQSLDAQTPLPPALDAIDLATPGAPFMLSGRGRPGTRLELRESPDGLSVAVATVDQDGRFLVSLDAATIPETQAELTLVGLVEADSGQSGPSAPVSLALPRIVVLLPGWNLASWAGGDAPGAEVLQSLPVGVGRVFAWTGSSWSVGVPGDPRFTIEHVAAGDGLWIFLDGVRSAEWRQRRATIPPRALAPGWHLLAWAGATSSTAVVATAATGSIESLFAWDAQNDVHLGYFAAAPAIGDLPQVPHLLPLWVFVGANGGPWPGSLDPG